MAVDRLAPWAPIPTEGAKPIDERFRAGRMLCEDGFCLGVMRAAYDGVPPYRGVLEAVCPICGRRAPLDGALDPRRAP